MFINVISKLGELFRKYLGVFIQKAKIYRTNLNLFEFLKGVIITRLIIKGPLLPLVMLEV